MQLLVSSKTDYLKKTAVILLCLTGVVFLPSCETDGHSNDLDGEYTMNVYDPSGATEIIHLHAERLPSLDGYTICLLSDFLWEAERTMPRIAENLSYSHPDALIVPSDELPDIYRLHLDDVEAAVEEKGCDAAIVGNAA